MNWIYAVLTARILEIRKFISKSKEKIFCFSIIPLDGSCNFLFEFAVCLMIKLFQSSSYCESKENNQQTSNFEIFMSYDSFPHNQWLSNGQKADIFSEHFF